MNQPKWTAAWSSSPAIAPARPARYAKDLTLRFILRMQLSGDALRLRLSNFGGKADAPIAAVCVAPMLDEHTQDVSALRPVTFGGREGCVIPAGGTVQSDEIAFETVRNGDVCVSLYIRDYAPLASGTDVTGPLSRFWFAEGNCAKDAQLSVMNRMKHDTVFFLDLVEVRSASDCEVLACFGDSITAQSWPDFLIQRCLDEDRTHLCVIRRGIGGSRVLRQYENLQHRSYGPHGADRFERELSGADRVIIMHGINDLIHPDGVNPLRPWSDLPTAEELIEGLRWYVRKGHEMGMKVYLGTIVTMLGWPSASEYKEGIRQEVNAWIRTQTEADGCVDFDAAIRDPDDPSHRAPEYDSGDHVHPSLAGAKAMAACVPAAFLE